MTVYPLDFVPSFGGVAAETDTLLKEAFEDHRAYLDARAHSKFLILGRKGSGKSAIFRKITDQTSSDILTIGLNFDDYPWHFHGKQKEEGVPAEQCYLRSWEYLIYLALAKLLLEHADLTCLTGAAPESWRQIQQFIEDTYGSTNPELTQVFSPSYELKIRGELGINWKLLQGKVSGERVPIAHLPVLFADINKNVLGKIVNVVPSSKNIYICFDGLDIGSSLNADDYEHRLMGLIQTARRINRALHDAGKAATAVLFLRDDIYGRLRFEDKNKVTTESSVSIRWDSASLKRLMERRFAKTLNIPIQGAWADVFDDTKKMPGKQEKLAYIADRTFLRPRDMIMFCNKILEAYKESEAERGAKFSNQDLHHARESYSHWLRSELDDELPRNVPNYEKYMELLRHIGSLGFSRDRFLAACDERKDLVSDTMRPIDILKSLFDFSIIGYYRPGGRGQGGAEYVWNYRSTNVLFNEHAQSFRTHPGLQETLGVKMWTTAS
ncbi:P-loop ATPase, Sll1717 family [Paracraurococcus lichenis]|uniref:FunZ protein n=1 Tax=Paracraurococcus lichenis TaxID=3064888 RepID=A0ABT9E0K3_9PROT|nr:hypothetical protein [Paracraurococcus sp. LOR1-02]MDO9709690.1 hypothetical protein [Paracraurococcus sp. LOR1-02]